MALLVCLTFSVAQAKHALEEGKAELQSIGALAFAPESVLLVADPAAAALFAIDVSAPAGDGTESSGHLRVEDVDKKIAALLGASTEEISIVDLAANQASGTVFLSVSRGRGPAASPALIKVGRDGKLALVSLDKVKHARVELPNAPAAGDTDRRGRSRRQNSITDLAYVDGRVLVAGLSNEEFASTLRSIPFPFEKAADGTGIEIYHGAHGQWETNSPIQTFATLEVGGETSVLAAYTCTPLVQIPVKELKPGAKVKGKTIAELGNRNQPLDMVVYEKDDVRYLLLANSRRGIMRIKTDGVEKVDPILTRVEGGGTDGQSFETISESVGEWQSVDQLDRLDAEHAVVVRRDGDRLHIETLHLP
jgi:hypothetical protein